MHDSSHSSSACRFLKEKCHVCGKLGHIAKVCRSSKAKDTKAESQPKAQRTAPKSTHVIAEGPVHSSILEDLEDSEDIFMIPSLTSRVAPIPVTVIANGQPLEIELDTGAAVSLISEDTYKAKFKDSVALKSSDITLHSYSGHFLTVMGTADLERPEVHPSISRGCRARPQFTWSQLASVYTARLEFN